MLLQNDDEDDDEEDEDNAEELLGKGARGAALLTDRTRVCALSLFTFIRSASNIALNIVCSLPSDWLERDDGRGKEAGPSERTGQSDERGGQASSDRAEGRTADSEVCHFFCCLLKCHC